LEARVSDKASGALKSLLNLAPQTARRIPNSELRTPNSELRPPAYRQRGRFRPLAFRE